MNDKSINDFLIVLKENIFTCMEWSKQSYVEVCNMPIQRLYDYLKWKTDLEEKKKQLLEEQTS